MRKYCALIFILLFTLAAPGQTNPETGPRKKIGLVLEGGSAYGLAHVGVIEWLDSHHIPVDYISGTSMGALIGGMYAMGYTPQEIHERVAGIKWDSIQFDRASYGDMAFRRREDQRNYPNMLALPFRKGIRLPEAFNAGHQVGLVLDDLTRPYAGLRSLDDLPVRFRCVGVDMVTSTRYVFGTDYNFKEGLLSNALRSTMSLPGVFSPVHDEDKIFIDGGLFDNLPVDVAQQMGAERHPLEDQASQLQRRSFCARGAATLHDHGSGSQ